MASLIPSLLAVGVLCVACRLFVKLKRFKPPFPPGPAPKSFITGNLSDVPLKSPWLKFTEWAETIGDFYYFRVLHKHNIVISSVEKANEFLENSGHIYSSRPPATMIEMMGWQWVTPLTPYGSIWRSQRRMFQRFFNAEASLRYQDVQTRKVHDLLYDLVYTPDDFLSLIQRTTGAIIMSITYDYDVVPRNDHFVRIAQAAIDNVGIAISPGSFLVNVLPILRFVPEWFPGAYFRSFAKETKALTEQMLNEPMELLKGRMSRGHAQPCIAASLLEGCDSAKPEELENIAAMCASSYAAGADTSVYAIQTFFLAMVKFQDVQARAQEEIDRVIGRDRLPTLADRASLPYIEAVCRETLRWHPMLPLAVPRLAIDENVWDGYYIPKDTVVIVNVWGMTRDRTRYHDPEDFNPSRFLDEDLKLNNDDVGYVFGFGRRLCPGRHLGFATVWLAIASTLATFNIRNKKDAAGNDIAVKGDYSGGLMSHPLPFHCEIIPRSEAAKKMVLDTISQRD